MVVAYVMVKASFGDADHIRTEIEACDGVTRAYIVAGDVDFIVRADVDSPADVKALAAGCIQAIEGVEDTTTYIAMT